MDEREQQAEKNFQVIKDRILQRNPDRLATDKNFVMRNIKVSKRSMAARKPDMGEIIKNRQLLAK